MDDEEETVFDSATLLGNSPKSVQRHRVFKTLCLCSGFLALGLCIAIPGPTLEDLRQQVHETIERISYMFTVRSVGYLAGSVVGGILFDKFNQQLLLCIMLFLTAIATAIAPWCTKLSLLCLLISFQGISMGCLDTGGNVLCLNVWGRQSGPYLQALHFTFGVGAFIAPLVAEPFLGKDIQISQNVTETINVTTPTTFIPKNTTVGKRSIGDLHMQIIDVENVQKFKRNTIKNVSKEIHITGPTKPPNLDRSNKGSDKLTKDEKKNLHEQKEKAIPTIKTTVKSELNVSEASTSTITTSTATIKPTVQTSPDTPSSAIKIATTTIEDVTLTNGTNTTTASTPKADIISSLITKLTMTVTKVQFAYLLIAAFLWFTSVLFLISYIRDRRIVITNDGTTEVAALAVKTGFRTQLLLLLFVFYFLYVGMEVTYGSFIFSFATKQLKWKKDDAVYLTSVFWGSFATTRGLCIFVAKYISPTVMLVFDLVVTCLSILGIILSAENNTKMTWFLTATIGMGMASIFPTGIAWAERYMKITGRAASIFVVGSALGEMCFPALTGLLFDKKNPWWMMYLLMAASTISVILFIILHNLASYHGDRYSLAMLKELVSFDNDNGDLRLTSTDTDQNFTSKKKVSFKLAPGDRSNGRATEFKKPLINKSSSKND